MVYRVADRISFRDATFRFYARLSTEIANSGDDIGIESAVSHGGKSEYRIRRKVVGASDRESFDGEGPFDNPSFHGKRKLIGMRTLG